MSDIDSGKLEEAIAAARARVAYELKAAVPYAPGPTAEQHNLLAAAAEHHLATLPKWKEVEVEGWAVIEHDGAIETTWTLKEYAESRARCFAAGHSVVRLTGKAKVKVTP